MAAVLSFSPVGAEMAEEHVYLSFSVSEIAHFYTYTYFFECTLRRKLECAKTQCTGNTSVAHSKRSKI